MLRSSDFHSHFSGADHTIPYHPPKPNPARGAVAGGRAPANRAGERRWAGAATRSPERSPTRGESGRATEHSAVPLAGRPFVREEGEQQGGVVIIEGDAGPASTFTEAGSAGTAIGCLRASPGRLAASAAEHVRQRLISRFALSVAFLKGV